MRTFLIVGLLVCTGAGGQQVEVEYLANEGVHLRGSTSVLIDALFGEGLRGYPALPAARRAVLEGARSPFDRVSLVLATHHHADHFDPAAVARFLEANRGASFVSTPQAVARLRPLLDGGELERVQEVLPREGEAIELTFGSVRLVVLALHHGRGGSPPTQNLGFIVQLDGRKILHVGDTEVTARELAPLELAGRGLDLTLLPIWYLTEPRWLEAAHGSFGQGPMAGMHIAAPDAPAGHFGSLRSRAARLERALHNLPRVVLFSEIGQSIVLEP